MKYRIIRLTFPRDLSPNQEDMLISAVQNVVLNPAKMSIETLAKAVPGPLKEKYKGLALTLNYYVNMDKINGHLYEIWWAQDNLTVLDTTFAGMRVKAGKLVPERYIRHFFRATLFGDMGFHRDQVKIESLDSETRGKERLDGV